MKTVVAVSIIVGTLGKLRKNIEKYTEEIVVAIRVDQLQKTTLIGTARILRKMFRKQRASLSVNS